MKKVSADVNIIGTVSFDSKRLFDDNMRNKIYTNEEYFRSKIIIKINESIKDNWHVNFVETDPNVYMVRIFTDSHNNYNAIRAIIDSNIKESIEDYVFEPYEAFLNQ